MFGLKTISGLKKNFALIEATQKHDQVVAFFYIKTKKFETQQAQKWWVSQSLKEFRNKLNELNINLEIIKTETYKSFFEKIFKQKNISIYWNKTYEPNYLKFDEYLSQQFTSKKIEYKIFKGNILNEFQEIKKGDGTPFKVFTPFWRIAERFYSEKIPIKNKKKYLSAVKSKLF